MFEIWFEIAVIDKILCYGSTQVIIGTEKDAQNFINEINKDHTFEAYLIDKYKVEM